MKRTNVLNGKKLLEANLTVRELRKIAGEIGQSIKRGWGKADILKALTEALTETSKKTGKAKIKATTRKPSKKEVAVMETTAEKTWGKTPKKKTVRKKAPLLLTEYDILAQEIEEDKIIAIARDPYWIFVFWEIKETTFEKYRSKLPDSHLYLKIYDITEGPGNFFDISVNERVNSRHIKIQPDREYIVSIGFFSAGGTFIPITKSNNILTPRDRIKTPAHEERIIKELYKAPYGQEELKIHSEEIISSPI